MFVNVLCLATTNYENIISMRLYVIFNIYAYFFVVLSMYVHGV